MLMLEHKGVVYRRVELLTGLHPVGVWLLGFDGSACPPRRVGRRTPPVVRLADAMGTVPALRVGDRRVRTNRAIARFLDELAPRPPLFPAERDRRLLVEEAERWGDEVLQMAARRLVLAAGARGRGGVIDAGDDGRLGPLLFRRTGIRLAAVQVFGRVFVANARSEAELLAAVPEMLDRIDAWIADGVLDGDQLNAADFMIAPSLALLCYRADLRAELERRPALRLVDRLLPEPGATQRGEPAVEGAARDAPDGR
jgi:glutathione S-transferase